MSQNLQNFGTRLDKLKNKNQKKKTYRKWMEKQTFLALGESLTSGK